MSSRTRGWTGLRASVFALGLAVSGSGIARADAITSSGTQDNMVGETTTPTTGAMMAYDTVGSWIGNTGITGGAGAVSFVPTTGGSFLTPSSLSLGAFQATALGAGQTVTYNNTPFHIMLNADGVNGESSFSPNQTPVDVTGTLNGTLSGSNQSSVVATFNKPTAADGTVPDPATYTFLTGLYTNTLKIPDNPLTIVPSSTNSGMTSAQAILNSSPVSSPVPEPSTVVLFAATIVGLGFRHRLRKGRTAAE